MRFLIVVVAGLLFGGGLAISGMTDPAKVVGFLDLFGSWDPTLAFVMGGALLVAGPGFYLTRDKKTSWIGESFKHSIKVHVDKPLVIGSALFGAGWGFYGLCPGPAITTLWTGSLPLVTFVVAMVAGLLIAKVVKR